MSLNINSFNVTGNLTRDPQVRFVGHDRAVAHFALAHNDRYTKGDGTAVEETLFIDVEAWGRTAELVGQYLVKGDPCYVEGRMKMDAWEDTKTGERRTRIKLVAHKVQFLSTKGRQQAPSDAQADGADETGLPAVSTTSTATEPARMRESRPTAPAAVPVGGPAAAGDDEPPF
jgi:single-strand DNA-binding protein